MIAPLPWVAWSAYRFACGDVRWDLFLTAGLALALAAIPRTRRFLAGIYPAFLVSIVYDSMRLYEGLGVSPDRVDVCGIRDAELAWFGIPSGGTTITLQDWFLTHHWTAVDVIAAIPYGTFLFVIVGYGAYLYFRDFRGLQRFSVAFLLLNVAALATHHLVPTAPPWYFHAHGCAVDLHAAASAGPALERVDALFGIHYFHAMYAQATEVFGALPSLHVGYPLLIALEGWRHHRWPVRAALFGFFFLMCFSAVYLDHHWVIDVLLGSLYATACYLAAGGVVQGVAHAALERVPVHVR